MTCGDDYLLIFLSFCIRVNDNNFELQSSLPSIQELRISFANNNFIIVYTTTKGLP